MKLPNKILTAVCCAALVLQSAALAPLGYAQAIGEEPQEVSAGLEAGLEPAEQEEAGLKAGLEQDPLEEVQIEDEETEATPEPEELPEAEEPPVTAELPASADPVQAELSEPGRGEASLAAFSNPNVILQEDFSGYKPGAKLLDTPGLNSANAATGFAGGWTPWVLDAAQTPPNASEFVIGSHQIGGDQTAMVPRATGKVGTTELGAGNAIGMYREMATPVELGSDSEYYVRFSFIMPEKALFNSLNRSVKLELLTGKRDKPGDALTDVTPLLTFGVITLDTASRDFYPFIKAGGVTNGAGFTAHRTEQIQVVARIRTTVSGALELSVKCYLFGEPEPADWNIYKLAYTNKQELTAVGFGTNAISGTDPGAEFGPIAIERYRGSEINAIAVAESAVNALRVSVAEADIPEAEELVAKVPDGMAKQNLLAGLESARTVILEQKAIMTAADSILGQWENAELSELNYQEAEEAVGVLKLQIEQLLNKTALAAYRDRVSALENKIAIVRIKVNRAEETFDYPAGTKLSSTEAAGTFSTGWKADAELAGALADTYVVGADGTLTLKGNCEMYRGLKYPVNLDQDVSSFIKLKFSFSGTEQFAGVSLGDLRFGVLADNGSYVPAIVSGDQTVKGNVSLKENQTYQAVVRLTGSASEGAEAEPMAPNIALAVYPEGEKIADWQVSAVSANMKKFNALGIVTDGSVTLNELSKDEAGHFYLNQFDAAVSEIKQQNTLRGILAAEAALEQMPDCIAKEIFTVQIAHAREVNEKTPPTVDYVTIDGTPKSGNILTGTYGLIDKMENAADPVLEWKSGSKVIAKGATWKVDSSYEGKTIAFSVTSKNQAGVEGNTKEYTIKISDNHSGGGNSRPGGGGGGGGGYTAGGTVTAPSTGNDQTDTDFQEVAEPYIFVDLIGHWAQSEIEELANLGILKGVSKDFFDPDATVTRAEFAAMLSRVLKNKQTAGTQSFSDVTESDWFWADVQNVASLGIMIGDDTGRFEPDRQISREEMAKAVVLAYNIYGGNTERGTAAEFADADEISEWALPYVMDCSALRLMNGLPNGCFAPAESATRAEAAVVIKHILNSK